MSAAAQRHTRFWRPANVISTWFGAGLLPVAPGTWGSLAALPFAWVILGWLGPVGLVVAAALVFIIGWWASERYIEGSGEHDPGEIVIDEVAGQFLVLAVAPLEAVWFIVGFIIFRGFDIFKPWPVSWAERRFAGGLGVMLDDVVAGIYGLVLLTALTQFIG